jgi:hypothetical protein
MLLTDRPPLNHYYAEDDLERRSRTVARKKGSSGGGKYRSSKTGKYVSAYYAKRHPKTTRKEKK